MLMSAASCRQITQPIGWHFLCPYFLRSCLRCFLPIACKNTQRQKTKQNHYWKWNAKWCKCIHIHLRRDLIPLVNKLKWIMNAWMCSITQYYACNRALGPCISSTGSAKYNRKNGPEKRYYSSRNEIFLLFVNCPFRSSLSRSESSAFSSGNVPRNLRNECGLRIIIILLLLGGSGPKN